MTAIGISCIIHSETPCQERCLSSQDAMSVNSGAAHWLTEEDGGGKEADWGRVERGSQVRVNQ